MDYVIQPLQSADEPILWEMLFEALQREGSDTTALRTLVRAPEFARYVEGWGRAGDAGFSAHDATDRKLLGAVWSRAPLGGSVPELALAVKSDHRGQGLGAALLTQWVRAHPEQSAVSLRVAPTNPAVRLYERFGFRVVAQDEHSVTMQRDG